MSILKHHERRGKPQFPNAYHVSLLDDMKLSARLETAHCVRLLVGALGNLFRAYLHPNRHRADR